MKVLIISSSFYPQTSPRSFRTTELIKEFCRQGHDVSLMTYYVEQDHKEYAKSHGFRIINLGKRKLMNLKLGDCKPCVFFSRVLTRLLLQIFEYPDIKIMFDVKSSLKKLQNDTFDLMISIAVPHPTHWGVAWAKKLGFKCAKIWVADCGDPFMGDKTDSFRKLFYFKYFEKGWCNLVDFITVPFEGAINGYYKKFHHKIRILPQGFNFEETKALKLKFSPNLIPTFIYAGIFIPRIRDPRPILKFLNSIDINFKLKIYTSSPEYIIDLVENSSGRIEVYNFIKRELLIKELSKAEFLLNIENSGIKENLPSKLIDYYLSGRPILSIDSNNIDFEKIIDFLKGNYSSKLIIEDIDKFNIRNIVHQLKQLTNSYESQ